MHAVLAHLYHQALSPGWRAPAAAVAAALLMRLGGWPDASRAAALALCSGWLTLLWPAVVLSPARPIERLPGFAVILLAFAWCAPRLPGRAALLALPVFMATAAWWISGAPKSASGIMACVPLCLCLLAALAAAHRLTSGDRGWYASGGALALACALFLAGGAPHWWRAAFTLACAAAALAGLPGATPVLAYATVLLAGLAILASDRGRFVPVDLSIAAPFLVWLMAPRIQPRLIKAGPALSTAVATAAASVILYAANRVLELR